ncbi:MAG: glutathione S-transferase N-terminal domain-containing protein [Gammaproteobacteria bacterium]
MIDLYYWPTPNGWKVSIMLEECGLPYETIKVHIGEGDQFKPDFLRISPNNKMPAIVDRDADGGPLALFESGAILMYLAEKSGRFMPADERGRWEVIQWLYWQMANLGPMAGQLGHFLNYAEEKLPYPIARYRAEYNRLLGVLNHRLDGREFIAGDYSVADMASWPWVRSHERLEQPLDEFPHVARWFRAVEERPAVKRGCELGMDWFDRKAVSEPAVRRNLFGHTAKTVDELASKAARDES